jgi:hypothetical protein
VVSASDGIENDRAFGFLQRLGLGVGNFQARDDVVGQVIAAHAEHAGVHDCAAFIDDVIGYAAAEIDHDRTGLLLAVAEHGLSGGVGAERVALHVDAEFFHATDRGLQARGQAVDLVEMRGELLGGETDRVVRARAVVEDVVLEQRVDDGVVGRQRLGAAMSSSSCMCSSVISSPSLAMSVVTRVLAERMCAPEMAR